ncbi:DEAD/DEAH box helicase [Clostridium botulinum]|uniref:DEAD/DEAH box helicase n=1 Tax=Clostridium botulinum TaxID=1491 RepID=UPI001C9B65FA|nr:DEAD/DEAH box helicase [Clostridium botulinum]MBY6898999.1 DEAD/DEAH box helicase [Clostridium botulinum]MBY6913510.1 DEAD/DEAH box helicase [Clostridium botulinum]
MKPILEETDIIDKQTDQYIDLEHKEIESADDKYLISNNLIVNSEQGNLLCEIKRCLSECEKFYFSVAFVNFSGIQLLLDSFKELEQREIEGKIITSTYLNFTKPKALKKIQEFNNIDLKVFVSKKEIGFHTKAYIFENEAEYKIIIGSSNITQRALKSNIEWNVKSISKKENSFTKEVLKEYLKLWGETSVVDDNFIREYDRFLRELKKVEENKTLNFFDYEVIMPNDIQKRALENLKRLRKSEEDKALVIAATGTGKTYMSAFDVIEYNPKKMLFLVHREEILRRSEKTFKKLVKNKNKTTGLLTGNSKAIDSDYLFSTIQTMGKQFQNFKKDEFEYIVIDEAHHISSPLYERVINYFEPKFLLGMTATPERCDGKNIFDIFNNNVALEVRLREALELELVIPFHYFGITDIEDIDLSDVKVQDLDEIAKRLNVNKRVDFIIDKMNFYGHDGEKRKCVGFCVNIDHAKYMADEFNKRGIHSVFLTGNNSANERELYIKKLEDDKDDLEVIFTVDIFNEGIDIPSINLILMLRPTNSPIVFIQQLGRGLRKYPNKTFLTVLDFIGNHNKTFLIALALNGSRYYDKDSLKVAVATQFSNLAGCTNIQMDRISIERILEQLNKENFNSMKYLKEDYMEFKKMNDGKVPYFLMDYIRYDGAPDPLKFLTKARTYLDFVVKMEKDESLKNLLDEEVFFKILKEFTGKLPIKRVYEFSILKYLLRHKDINLEEAKKEILKYIEYVDDNSIEHAFSCLNQQYYDSSQLKNSIKCFNLKDGMLKTTSEFDTVIYDIRYRKYIEDIINYGLIRYEKEFSSKYYGVPFFKLYEQYQIIDTALLSNYTKIHSSFRGMGLITNGKEYFLFIDLHKDDDIKESINYKDKFIDDSNFQWQTPNSTSQNSERGKNIIFNKERGVNLHIFIRKYGKIDGVVQKFIYIGKGDVISYKGEKPITVEIKLYNKVPTYLYNEFVKKV